MGTVACSGCDMFLPPGPYGTGTGSARCLYFNQELTPAAKSWDGCKGYEPRSCETLHVCVDCGAGVAVDAHVPGRKRSRCESCAAEYRRRRSREYYETKTKTKVRRRRKSAEHG